jgi:phosphomannomutase|tara:strand:+ start:920 stop:1147 length:228 start_codon:yes stop_codon:yes gene_type:complete
VDIKIQSFKDQLRKEEEREIRRVEEETKQKLQEFDRDLSSKFDTEKQSLVQYYERIRKTVEESEQERFDFEIEKF